jgi:hypothetical protein
LLQRPEHGTTRQLGVSQTIPLCSNQKRDDSHLFPVDGIVGDLEVGLRPRLLVVEPVAEQDDLDGVRQERYGKGLPDFNQTKKRGTNVSLYLWTWKDESSGRRLGDAHGGDGEDREVSVEQTGSEAEGGSGVGHCGWGCV